ncbi:MAG: hypothetical protein IAE79_05185 [Anaerolinea sp.]|nr:hypothetical protein [Anaerolinea sp.]
MSHLTISSPPTGRDNLIYRETKWLALFIIPFLIAAFALLYFWPNHTDKTFAWTIRPTMTPMMLAAAYIGGVFYFAGVVRAQKWSHIKVGFLPVTAFASILSIATILHWDRFNHQHISFFTWTSLYMTTPFLVIATWLRNRRRDPGTPDKADALIANSWRWLMGAVGAITVVTSLLLFLQPAMMIDVWPWTLTPLTARVISAMFALPGLVGLGIAWDARWSAAKLILQSQGFSIVFILIGVIRAWEEFDPDNIVTFLFTGGLLFLLVGIAIFYWRMESNRPNG